MRYAIIRLIITVVATLWVVTACLQVSTPRTVDPTTYDIVPATCWEDEPCWDCHTMGNRICGPGHRHP